MPLYHSANSFKSLELYPESALTQLVGCWDASGNDLAAARCTCTSYSSGCHHCTFIIPRCSKNL